MNLQERYLGIRFPLYTLPLCIPPPSEIFPHLTPTIESIDEGEEEPAIFSCI
jgi:hypothetical protein